MKKVLSILILPVAFIFFSCGTTSNAASLPQISGNAAESESIKTEETEPSPSSSQTLTEVPPESETSPQAPADEELKDTQNAEIPEPENESDNDSQSSEIPEGITAENFSQNNEDSETTFEVVTVEDASPEEIPQDQLVLENEKTESEQTEEQDPIKEIAQAVAKLEEKVDGLIAEKENSKPLSEEIETPAPSAEPEQNSPEPVKITAEESKIIKETATETQTATSSADAEQEPSPEQVSPAAEISTPVAETETSESNETDLFNSPALITPSRSVTVKKNQYLDVTYPGNGWIYIGETQKDPLLTYFGRKLSKGNTTFSLKSKKSGQTVLHFYKNDPLTGNYIDDYLDVTVETEAAKSNSRTKAPDYALIVPPKPEKRGMTAYEPEPQPEQKSEEQKITSAPSASKPAASTVKTEPERSIQVSPSNIEKDDANIKTVIEKASTERDSSSGNAIQDKTDTKTITLPAGNLLEEAKKALAEKKYQQALSYIQVYLDSESTRIDEALFVQGQILEAESPVKNVRSAIDSYNTIVKQHPASRWWKKANERSIYLKRFYIDIR